MHRIRSLILKEMQALLRDRQGRVLLVLPVIMQLAKHPLTDAGIKKFLEDWEKVPK